MRDRRESIWQSRLSSQGGEAYDVPIRHERTDTIMKSMKPIPLKAIQTLISRSLCFLPALLAVLGVFTAARADSDPAHVAARLKKPLPWPEGVVPYDVAKLTEDQQKTVLRAMQRWTDTGARVRFVPHSNQVEYVHFTGQMDAGNNTSGDGFRKGARVDVNITAFWWRQGEWMPAHELGHVLGFHHEHQRWDRDQYVTIHYEHIKPGRQHDYDWIPKTNWIVSSTAYDYKSIMHYRTCWASSCESECQDGDGSSPCVVIDPVGTNFDRVIGQWGDNGISATDGEKLRLVYGSEENRTRK
jgi:hypothetical protein